MVAGIQLPRERIKCPSCGEYKITEHLEDQESGHCDKCGTTWHNWAIRKNPKKSKTKNKDKICVQCDRECQAQTIDGNYNVCIQPDCPNFGLVQVSYKAIKDFENDQKTN